MTLDEAIEHLEESLNDPNHFSCEPCRKEHEQLRNWLVDYKNFLLNKSIYDISQIDIKGIKENKSIKELSEFYNNAIMDNRAFGIFMMFDGPMIDWLNQKFNINTQIDLYKAIRFMINEYMNEDNSYGNHGHDGK